MLTKVLARHWRRVLLALIALALVVGVLVQKFDLSTAALEKEARTVSAYAGSVTAPDFPEGLEWLNTNRPLSLAGLRGKVVLLDFWTYCCINCMHVIPDLKRLEKKYASELAVIGVHSAKFTTERETENIRQAILRYEIEHPVVNDRDMLIWREYGVNSWPTLVLIDPAGKVAGSISGEDVYEPLDTSIARAIETFDARGKLDRRPLNARLERDSTHESLLSFPGKVLADEPGQRLFIADSNHNRIVVISLADSSVQDVIGSGEIGMADGTFEQGTFHHPQGMALDGNALYIADTENHAIRRADLEKRTVATIAGTGKQNRGFTGGGPGKRPALNSPWDLILHKGSLYIAMAGPHQLWKMDLKTGEVGPYAGSGREARIDGPLASAALAQPSGITTDGKELYFADSEVSSIRSADLDPKGRVETLAGGDLFDFGDHDGKGLEARFQHPLGVVYRDGALYVADTYNNKVKRISLDERVSQTFLGTGEAGLKDGEHAAFYEPGGLALANGRLFIADTNNHVIRVADLKTRRVETLQITGVEKLKPPRVATRAFAGEVIELPAQSVRPGEAALTISLELPRGYKLNPQAPSRVELTSSDERTLTPGNGGKQSIPKPHFPVKTTVKTSEGTATLSADLVLYYCESKKESLCYFKEARLNLPVKVERGAKNGTLSATYRLRLP